MVYESLKIPQKNTEKKKIISNTSGFEFSGNVISPRRASERERERR